MSEQVNSLTGEKSRNKEKLKATILFVDDEKNILSSLNRLFRPFINKVLIAESGKAGLEILENETVDIVISDMRMPEMDGAQFLEKVAEKWPDTIRILLTGYADITSTINAINKGSIYRYISKPWEDNDIKLTVEHALQGKFLEQERLRLQKLTESQNLELQDLNANLEEKVKSRTEEVRQTMGQLEVTYAELKNNYVKTIKVFSSIVELGEGGKSTLTRITADLAQKIATASGMSEDNTEQVVFACQLRNLGKIGLSDEINKKPFYKLNSEEKEQVIKHPVIGQGVLMSLDYLQYASGLIRHQSERYDGEGYPDKIKGGDIPIGARIIAIANDYYALQSGLLSSHRFSATDALDFIKQNSGVRYDPKLVDILHEILGVTDPTTVEVKEETIKELKISSLKLIEGMILSRDLTMKNGVVLLAKGQKLDNALILRIRKMENSVNEKMDIYILA